MKVYIRGLLFVLVLAGLTGCAGFAGKMRASRSAFERGDYTTASAQLKRLAEEKDRDELLYWLELGIVEHTAGKYKEAIEAFQKAEKIAEIKDYTSLTTEAATVLISETVKGYRGEDFEKVLINVYLAMDYALMGNSESALVECRKVNHILERMIREGKLPYDKNAFAKYLAGALFESDGELDSALVDYRQLFRWRGTMPYLGEPILRLTHRLQMEQEFQDYKKKFPLTKTYKLSKGEGEVILLLEQGQAPHKVVREGSRTLPRFEQTLAVNQSAILRVDTGTLAQAEPYFDIEGTAIKELEHRIGLIIAKKVAGVVAKELVAAAVEKSTDSKLAGVLTRIFLYASDQADLRSWTFLPATLQVARMKVPAGKHDFFLDTTQTYGGSVQSYKKWDNIEVKPGKITFLNARIL